MRMASGKECFTTSDRYISLMYKDELVYLVADLAGKVEKSEHGVVFDKIVSVINADQAGIFVVC